MSSVTKLVYVTRPIHSTVISLVPTRVMRGKRQQD